MTLPAVANPHEIGKSALGHYPERVYVPNTIANTVHVIDPKTFQIIGTYPTSKEPHHVTPSWDLTRLYVNNTKGNSLTVIDPSAAKVVGEIPVLDPYNLYFTPDGKQFWITGRYHGEVAVIDTTTGEVIRSIHTNPGPHGLTYFPTSKAAHNVGHNGIYVED